MARTFGELTALIPSLERGAFGEWIVDRENDGSPERPIRMPFVRYTAAADRFVETFYRFCEEHPEYGHTRYLETLEEYGLSDANAIKNADVSRADAKLVIALLTCAVRAERFCGGALLGFKTSGCVVRWLKRLDAIDRSSEIPDAPVSP